MTCADAGASTKDSMPCMEYGMKFILSAICMVAIPALGYGAVLRVPQQYATPGDAVAAAPDGSTILVGPGTYPGFEALDLGKNLLLLAEQGPDQTIFSGAGFSRLFRAENGPGGDPEKNLVFDGFTFADGFSDHPSFSPVSIVSAKTAFLNCRFIGNRSRLKGGAAVVYGLNAHPVFVHCWFEGNESDTYGGAVLINGAQAQATFRQCTFLNNSTRTPLASNLNQGGALNFTSAGGLVDQCDFISNRTTYAGGAIMALTPFGESASLLTVRGCRFVGNEASPRVGLQPAAPPPSEGGAIMIENNVQVLVEGCVFSNNVAATGGGIMVYRSTLTVRGTRFDNNIANGTDYLGGGGALAINAYDAGPPDHPEATVWLEDVAIRNNHAPVGGGITAQGDPYWDLNANHRGRLYMQRVVLDNNRSTVAANSYGNGGGLFLNLMLAAGTNVYLLNNTADSNGGAVAMVQNSLLSLTDSFVVGNQAAVDDEVHAPGNPVPLFINTVRAYNGNPGSANLSRLFVIPPRTYENTACLVYLNLPYGSPTLSPRPGILPDRGGYAAGTILDPDASTTTSYQLTSQFPAVGATAFRSQRGLPSAAFGGSDLALPAVIEAEGFDVGAYPSTSHDRTPPNEGGALRPSERIDIGADPSAGGGFVVGWMAPGEWMDYTVWSPGDTYSLGLRIASPSGGALAYASLDGEPVTPLLTLPGTGAWNAWQELVTPNIFIPPGYHTLRFHAAGDGFNLDQLRIFSSLPRIGVTPGRLLRSVKIGRHAGSHDLHVFNAGGGGLPFTATSNVPWLTVSPSSGFSTGPSVRVRVDYVTDGLTTGTYNGAVVVQSGTAENAPISVPVRLRVVPDRYVINDFDGDGSSDLGVYFAPGGNWYVFRSTLGFYADQFGYLGTVPIAGDFDGDGRSDLAVYYPPGGNWYIFGSSRGFFTDQFGFLGTIPVSGDYDGDGITDLVVYHPPSGTWYMYRSQLGFHSERFGYAGTVPVSGDFDGDGVYDLAVYYPPGGNWNIKGSQRGEYTETFGYLGTVPISGDFDGDGISDLAVYFPPGGNWYIYGSRRGFFADQFGYLGTIPVPGDFDADGQSDLAVYYPPGGNWYIFRSSEGFLSDQFGYLGTVPLGSTPAP